MEARISRTLVYFTEYKHEDLVKICKPIRFYNNKEKYLISARKNFSTIYYKMLDLKPNIERRQWLVDNVAGLGMKAASHFLRNSGATDLAIIDTHIMKFMGYSYKSPKNTKEYLEIEKEFKKIAKKHKLSCLKLDAWEEFVC